MSVVRRPGTSDAAAARAREQGTTVAVVDPDATDKGAVLDAIAGALAFPATFGHNLDALEDCLRDLAWLPEGRVELVWDDAALRDADPDTHASVVEILTSAAGFQADGPHPLGVVLTGS